MTTIAVVKKNNQITIAADTLTKWGSAKESATYIKNHGKILQVQDGYLALTGSATFKHILAEFFDHHAAEIDLRNVPAIFRTWQRFHTLLKERYFLQDNDKDEDLESSKVEVLLANPHGIFGISAHRTVQEFTKFYSYGSGSDYAMGALYTNYDRPEFNAQQLAEMAIATAAEFDDSTGLPLQSFVVNQISL